VQPRWQPRFRLDENMLDSSVSAVRICEYAGSLSLSAAAIGGSRSPCSSGT